MPSAEQNQVFCADYQWPAPPSLRLCGLLQLPVVRSQQLVQIRHEGTLPGDPENKPCRRNIFLDGFAVGGSKLLDRISLPDRFAELRAHVLLVCGYRICVFSQNSPSGDACQEQDNNKRENYLHIPPFNLIIG